MIRRVALAASFAALVVIYLVSTVRDLRRGPQIDEVEHLHTAARMTRGDRIYVDFAQHHPPLFHAVLMPLVGDVSTIEGAKAYVVRARILVAVMTAIAILAAAFVVFSAAGDPWSVVIFVALLFAAGGIWRNGLGDIRPDTASLAVWWIGAALVMAARERPVVRGAGIGLVFLAALVIPKWPLMSIVLGVVFLLDVRKNGRALAAGAAVAAAIGAAGIGAIACFSNLRLAAFHVLRTSSVLVATLPAMAQGGVLRHNSPMFGCPLLFRPINVALACALVLLAWFLATEPFASRRIVAILLALLVAAACEIRFVDPYPEIGVRFWVNWTFVSAALFAVAVRGAAALLPQPKWRRAIHFFIVPLALLAATDLMPAPRPTSDTFWESSRWLMSHMRPGDTVWIGSARHPLGAADASYYWYGFPELIAPMMKLARTDGGRRYLPPLTERDLPPCRVERGLDPRVRFLETPPSTLPIARACFRRLVAKGAIVSTPVNEIWMVRRPSDRFP